MELAHPRKKLKPIEVKESFYSNKFLIETNLCKCCSVPYHFKKKDENNKSLNCGFCSWKESRTRVSANCSECKNPVSCKNKCSIICNVCVAKRQKPEKEELEKIEKLKEEEEKIKNKIEKDNFENNLLNNHPIYDDKKFIDFYDIILKINSIRDILNGWNIELVIKVKLFY